MGFKNSGNDFSKIEPAGASSLIPAGGYVAVIKSVEDVESKEYLRFTYDIAEGQQKGFFADDEREYTHQFTRSYKEKALPFMSQFLRFVEASNSGFNLAAWNNDPNDLVGKLVGVVIQREDYTNRDGEDRVRMNVEGFASAEDIRNGRFKMPEPKDSREKKEAPKEAQGSVYDADIPF